MPDCTRVLFQIADGDSSSAEQQLPLVYDELRRLAGQYLAQEKHVPTLQASAPVHEACVRLVDVTLPQCWDNCGHFYAAAAQAMRRILIENARRRRTKNRRLAAD